jgi:hypothetical protein
MGMDDWRDASVRGMGEPGLACPPARSDRPNQALARAVRNALRTSSSISVVHV